MASDKKTNDNLHKAKNEKNDEFYTQLPDIHAEMVSYTDKFKDKVVFCNCDDPFESNFVKYFLMNFNRLGLKELIATGYKTSPIVGIEIGKSNTPYVLRVRDTKKYLVGTQKDLDIAGAKYFLKTEGNHIMTPLIGNTALDENGNPIKITIKAPVVDDNNNPVLTKTGKPKLKTEETELYYEAGDFRSDMALSLLKESDIVVTNPPFSLFREYVATLIKYQKQFIIIGNLNAATYKEIYPLLQNNTFWLGTTMNGTGQHWFAIPDHYDNGKIVTRNGKRYATIGSACWFTNIDHLKRHQILPIDLGYKYYGHEDMYPTYDNYDAINIDKVNQIPCDYTGVMGVPIGFLTKYCPEQFEIVRFRYGNDNEDLRFNGKCPYFRILIRFTDTYIKAHSEQFNLERS